MTTQEGNKLIADFSGDKIEVKGMFGANWDRIINETNPISPTPNYHESWEWLMPVVLKMLSGELFTFDMNTIGDTTYVQFDFNNGKRIKSNNTNPITAVWQAVTQYISKNNDGRNLEAC